MSLKDNKKLIIFQPLIYALIMMMGMVLGFKLYQSLGSNVQLLPSTSPQSNTLSQINDVLNFVEYNYVDTIDTEDLVGDAIREILKNLDPHSIYIPPEDMKATTENLQGNFEGIGVEFFIVDDTISVITPIAGGPSEALGILSGDKIVTIENDTVAGIGITNRDVIKKLRGKKGTKVKVGINRHGINELLSFNIKRDKIPLNSVDVGYMMDEQVGFIKINRFSETTYNEFSEQLIKLKSKGMEDLVIDLRQNPGGYLVAATNIIDELLGDKRLIVYTEGRSHKRSEYKARRNGIFEDGRLVVLIDEGSASASEILAGAVQDWDRGTIVGRRSFGKGLVQEQFALKNGGALRLTVARYYTPAGRSIQKPYKPGEGENYDNELVERFDKGEMLNEDSIENDNRTAYKTALGRTVYGGGGITPDIFTPIDTINNDLNTIFANSQIPSFTYNYFSKHRDDFTNFESFTDFKDTYQVPQSIFDEFYTFVKEKRASVTPNVLLDNEFLFKTKIKAYFAKQVWKNEGYYSIIREIDTEIQKAYDFIKNDNMVLNSSE